MKALLGRMAGQQFKQEYTNWHIIANEVCLYMDELIGDQ